MLLSLTVPGLLVACNSSGVEAGATGGPPPASSAAADGQILSGTVLLDGATNGCGGEEVLVQVRDGGSMVASQIAGSQNVGADCVFAFALPVPELACYELHIAGHPVGRYPASGDGKHEVGIIDSDSVYGDPETGADPRPYADFDGIC